MITASMTASSAGTELSRGMMRWHPELVAFAGLLIVANLHLLGAPTAEALIFQGDRVIAGELWRVFTHPFVHVSFYQLALDGGAFFLCYMTLRQPHLGKRLMAIVICSLGGLGGAYLFGSVTVAYGFCGLSGAAHGVLALSMLEMISDEDRINRMTGCVCLAILIGKCVYEVITGVPFLGGLHFGNIGVPLLGSHLGGAVAGMLIYGLWDRSRCSVLRKCP
jgi:rhomboid family GlyGly-CTERM serine protease